MEEAGRDGSQSIGGGLCVRGAALAGNACRGGTVRCRRGGNRAGCPVINSLLTRNARPTRLGSVLRPELETTRSVGALYRTAELFLTLMHNG
jgi:hypothetical protein